MGDKRGPANDVIIHSLIDQVREVPATAGVADVT
jgi:hypothetical protein